MQREEFFEIILSSRKQVREVAHGHGKKQNILKDGAHRVNFRAIRGE
jgi:hypothetical protein